MSGGGWRGGTCNFVTSDDADMLGRVAAYLDSALKHAVDDARSKTTRQIVYVDRADLFDDSGRNHSLCTSGTEWVNGVSAGFWDGSLRWQHSFHPNEIGHQATAEFLAGQLAQNYEQAPVPATAVTQPPAPPITTGTGHFDVGDTFDSYCYVAWPTAPTRTTQYIEMTMSCSGVPQQYPLVDVAYPDPNLPITPSTGRVHVHGKIVDIATSELGFRELVVEASKVDLP